MPVAHKAPDSNELLRRALDGESFLLDRAVCTLHDLTQIAAVLHPGADLAIRHSELMTPIEKSSIATVARGRIVFL